MARRTILSAELDLIQRLVTTLNRTNKNFEYSVQAKRMADGSQDWCVSSRRIKAYGNTTIYGVIRHIHVDSSAGAVQDFLLRLFASAE